LDDLLGGVLGGGAPAGGVTQNRSGGSTSYAALASLGMMAFQAYQAWQRSQASAPQQPPRTVDLLSGPDIEDHSHAVLRALIAAAKADGRIDAAEKQISALKSANTSMTPTFSNGWMKRWPGRWMPPMYRCRQPIRRLRRKCIWPA
jgi:uncharacterized membrane protein YebE (DUF533 family)